MKNSHGMTRSKEFMKSHSGSLGAAHEASESSSEKKLEEETGKEELHHMRVYPAVKGEVKVTHHLGEQEPASETHAFEVVDGEKLTNHILEHSGATYGSEGGGEHYADESKTATA